MEEWNYLCVHSWLYILPGPAGALPHPAVGSQRNADLLATPWAPRWGKQPLRVGEVSGPNAYCLHLTFHFFLL